MQRMCLWQQNWWYCPIHALSHGSLLFSWRLLLYNRASSVRRH